MESSFDIDLSGDEELPPGVRPGSLGGTDEPPPEAEPLEQAGETETPVEPSAVEIEEARSAVDLDADFEAALAGDDEVDVEAPAEVPQILPAESDATTAVEGAEAPGEVVTEPPAPEPARPKRKKAPKRAPRARATAPATTTGSGPAARQYIILQKTRAEVEGNILDVFIHVSFVNPDDPNGDPLDRLRARNRKLALRRAGKLFGHGFEGSLIAVPEGMWEEMPVRNKPREQYHVEVG